jgi:oligopeptidase A
MLILQINSTSYKKIRGDTSELKGLPESIIQGAAAEAKKQEKEGWILSLQTPVVLASMKLLDNRHLRKILYHAYNTLASEVNPGTEQWNNLPLIETILRLRHRKAQLLGHNNYAEFALGNKMAKDPQTVFDFLTNLANKSAGPAKRELAEIRAIAAKDGITDLEPWDSPYYAEKLRLQKYNLSEEATKPYFPLEKVLSGFFTVLNKLYGITLREEKPDDVWHEDVRYFGVYDEDNQPLGCVYADFYARPKKRDGAWMTEGRSRVRFPNGELQLPIAYLSTDFGKPGNETPALLEFRDAETLFHEFGHCIHQILTTMEVKSVSGINGVPQDGIEFPSQLMEFFVHDPAVIPLISSHYQTGEPLPVDMLERIQAAKHFQAAMMTIKQVYLALFDFRLHWEYDPEKGARTIDILTEIQKQYMPMQPAPEDNRFPCQFTHVFSDDYAVGYYGYKWSEVLSSDAFSRFEAAGTLSADVGRELRHYLLGQGGTPDFMEAYVKFRGRQPRIESLLHYTGLDKLPGLSEAGKIQAPVLFNDRKRKATADPVVSDEEKEENSMDVPKMG